MTVSKTLQPHLSLFEDWCEAFDKPFLPTTPDTIVEFLRAFPSGVPTNTLRVRAVRHEHADTGTPLDLDALMAAAAGVPTGGLRGPRSLIRTGPGTTRDVSEALAQQPVAKYPDGLRGRRNAMVLVLALTFGWDRARIHDAGPSDVVTWGGEVWVSGPLPAEVASWPPADGVWNRVPRGETGAGCARCALYRWATVLPLLDKGNRDGAKVLLNHYRFDPDEHDCDGENPFTPDFYSVPSLTAAIDQHGWAETRDGLSTRTISAIAGAGQQHSGHRELAWAPREVKATRFDDMGAREFADVMDDFDRKAAEALARSAAILADADEASESMLRMLGLDVG